MLWLCFSVFEMCETWLTCVTLSVEMCETWLTCVMLSVEMCDSC